MKLRFLAVAFAATFMLSALTRQAAVPINTPQPLVYAQNSDFNGAISSQNDTTGGNGLFAQAWDNFTLGTNTSIEEVQWIGSYFNPPNQGVITGFTVQFWSDSGGQPGVMLQDNFTATNANEQSLGLDNAGDPTFLYGLNLSTAFSASANTQYWLSVYPDLGFPPQWGWETGTGGRWSVVAVLRGRLRSLSATTWPLLCSAPRVPGRLSRARWFFWEPASLVWLARFAANCSKQPVTLLVKAKAVPSGAAFLCSVDD